MSSLGKISLIIRDYELDFTNIDSSLSVKATTVIKKGHMISKTRIAKFDIWIYDVHFFSIDDIEIKIKEFVDVFGEKQAEILRIKNQYKYVGITCNIVTEYGQVGILLSPYLVEKLNMLSLGIDFDIISYGNVEN
ncbi:MAG: DUF4279 domain-containing protein [Vallitalea sp.]|jgi:hypothetical protein|nr:DUF4279 domain-containing protein [Vallitalea sp.]MCT4597693.1 DUF4279 domain-containing protein [Vallitalea sp.]